MYVQMIGSICGGRVIGKDNKNGSNCLDIVIQKKLLLIRLVAFMVASFSNIYFALGGFGSPEKHRGFVLLLFGDRLNLLNLLNLN